MATVYKLLDTVTAATTGDAQIPQGEHMTFQASGKTTSGAGAASVLIQVSNDKVNWLLLGTITLTLATTESADGFAAEARWAYARAKLDSVSGTGAAVTVTMGS